MLKEWLIKGKNTDMSLNTAVKENLNKLMEKELDRKDFLKHVGIAVVMVSGAGAIISALLRHKNVTQTPNASVNDNYGSINYGGK
jgi:hypothetical protein